MTDEDDFPDFGDWDIEGLGHAFDDARTRAIFTELASIFNEEVQDRETWDRIVEDTRPTSGGRSTAAMHAAAASSRFEAVMVLRTIARYLAKHEARG